MQYECALVMKFQFRSVLTSQCLNVLMSQSLVDFAADELMRILYLGTSYVF